MSVFPRRAAPALALTALLLGGCHQPAPPPPPAPPRPGVSANSGGDTRGTILYQPAPTPRATSPQAPPKPPPNPYAPVSDKFVIGQRQQMAWALAEIDLHAHQQSLHGYPVPDPSWKGYSRAKAQAQAVRQAQFNAYLLEKYHARFCNQFHVTYDQLVLIIREGREKNWPMPPAPKDP